MTDRRADFPHRELFTQLFGADAYLVGGCVRDWVIGRSNTDWDILVRGVPLDEIVARLEPHGRVDCVGKSFGVIKFTTDNGRGGALTYDVALPRTDSLLDPSVREHRNFRVSSDPELPVEADLERRDFRINSMAIRVSDGTLIDPFGGLEDIENRCLRITNPRTFTDDPLRVLRLARFAAVLDFAVDPSLYAVCSEVDLTGLSVERVADELIKMLLKAARPGVGMQEMLKLGVLRQLFPEIYALSLCIQDALFHPEADEYGHHTVFHHTLLTLDQAQRAADLFRLEPPRRLALLLAALLHDIGKPKTSGWEHKHGRLCVTSSGHDVAGAKMAEAFLTRLRIFSFGGLDLQPIICSLVQAHLRPMELWANRTDVTRRAFGRLAADVAGETELLVLIDLADRAGRGQPLILAIDECAEWLLAQFAKFSISRETLKPLVHGRDLLALGFQPGPSMGRVLRELLTMQIDGVFQTREEGVAMAHDVCRRIFGGATC